MYVYIHIYTHITHVIQEVTAAADGFVFYERLFTSKNYCLCL